MKTNKRLSLILLLSTFTIFTSLADSHKIEGLTDYQNERAQLANELMSSLTQSLTQPEQLVFFAQFTSWMKENADDYKISDTDPLGELELLEAYIAEICGVMPWMIGSDDNTLYEEIQFRQYNAMCKQYFSARKTLDKQQTAETIAHESQVQKERAQARANANRIDKQIRKDLASWHQKGEYEKTVDYEKRLRNSSRWAFDSICQNAIDEHWKDDIRYRVYDYDADTEILPIKLLYGDKQGNEFCSVMYNIAVSPDWIRELKASLEYSFSDSYIISEGVYNHHLFPIKIMFTPRDIYQKHNGDHGACLCTVATTEVKPLVIRFDELGVDNSNLSGIENVASFEQFYQRKNELIDAINSCNEKLRQHPAFSYHDYDYSIKHAETCVSTYGGNNTTQIDAYTIDYFSGIENNKLVHIKKNKINPSAQSYEDFKAAIHLFYQECVTYFDFIAEVNTLFPYANYGAGFSDDNILQSIFSHYFYGLDRLKLKDSQNESVAKLAEARSEQLKKLYTRVCNEIINYESVNKEYTKNQQYFSSPKDFVNAYILSGNYKEVLKSRK